MTNELKAMPGWMPIETAPKEYDQRLIGLLHDGRAVTMVLLKSVSCWKANGKGGHKPAGYVGIWSEETSSAFFPCHPTHWMRLDPPSAGPTTGEPEQPMMSEAYLEADVGRVPSSASSVGSGDIEARAREAAAEHWRDPANGSSILAGCDMPESWASAFITLAAEERAKAFREAADCLVEYCRGMNVAGKDASFLDAHRAIEALARGESSK